MSAKKKTETAEPVIRVTLVRSLIGSNQGQGDTVRSMGLRKIGQTVELADNASSRGMVNKVRHLVTVQESV